MIFSIPSGIEHHPMPQIYDLRIQVVPSAPPTAAGCDMIGWAEGKYCRKDVWRSVPAGSLSPFDQCNLGDGEHDYTCHDPHP